MLKSEELVSGLILDFVILCLGCRWLVATSSFDTLARLSFFWAAATVSVVSAATFAKVIWEILSWMLLPWNFFWSSTPWFFRLRDLPVLWAGLKSLKSEVEKSWGVEEFLAHAHTNSHHSSILQLSPAKYWSKMWSGTSTSTWCWWSGAYQGLGSWSQLDGIYGFLWLISLLVCEFWDVQRSFPPLQGMRQQSWLYWPPSLGHCSHPAGVFYMLLGTCE